MVGVSVYGRGRAGRKTTVRTIDGRTKEVVSLKLLNHSNYGILVVRNTDHCFNNKLFVCYQVLACRMD